MKPTVKYALIALAVIVVWILSGQILPSNESSEEDGKPETAVELARMLEVESMESTPKQRFVVLYGETEPNRSVDLKAETQGAVVGIMKKEGEPVKKGDVLINIDPRDRHERLRRAEALVKQRQIEYKASVNLQEKGFRTEVGLAESKTRLEDAKAELKSARLDLDHTTLESPFDGVLESVNGEIGDFVGVGVFGGEGAIATVVDLDPIKVTGQISQTDLPYLDKKNKAFIKLTTGHKYEGNISYVSSVADKTSRSFRVEVEIPNPDRTIPAGVAAELNLPLAEQPAYLVNSSVLALADNGDVGVKHVQADGTVRFAPVTIMQETEEGVWITGLPATINLVTLGHTYVTDGQKIDLAALRMKQKEAQASEEGDE